jgi:murein L,D-transpeptidase YafK
VVQKGRVFKKEEDLSVWVTDDMNHLPILAQAKIMVGSIKMELTSYEGLASSVARVK